MCYQCHKWYHFWVTDEGGTDPGDGPVAGNRSSTAGKAYASRGESRRPYMARLPDATYEALMAASEATGVSANALVREAVDSFLAGERFAARLDRARREHRLRVSSTDEAARRQQAAIAKLSGAEPPGG